MDKFEPKSSFLTLAEYDDKARAMTITFKTGSQVKYMYVFPATWLSFKEAKDHSSYYSRAIKGKLMSISIVKKTIGHTRSTPLHQIKQKRGLNNGKRNIKPAGNVEHGNIPRSLIS